MEIKYYITVEIPDEIDNADFESVRDKMEDEFVIMINDYGFKVNDMEVK